MSTAEPSDWTTVHGTTHAARSAYIFESGLHSDVTLIVGVGDQQERVKAHKLILMTASPVFEQIFTDPAKNELEIPEVEPKYFRQFLKFVYTGEWVEESTSAMPVLNAATFYKLPDLAEKCWRILKRDLTMENAIKMFQQAVLYKYENLKNEAKIFICKFAYIIFNKEDFLDLSEECLKELLELDELAVKDEGQLFEALVRWAGAECERQGSPKTTKYYGTYLEKLIPLVRFPQMDKSEFAMNVAFREILTQDQVTAAFIYYEIPLSRRSESRGPFNAAARKYYRPAEIDGDDSIEVIASMNLDGFEKVTRKGRGK